MFIIIAHADSHWNLCTSMCMHGLVCTCTSVHTHTQPGSVHREDLEAATI